MTVKYLIGRSSYCSVLILLLLFQPSDSFEVDNNNIINPRSQSRTTHTQQLLWFNFSKQFILTYNNMFVIANVITSLIVFFYHYFLTWKTQHLVLMSAKKS